MSVWNFHLINDLSTNNKARLTRQPSSQERSKKGTKPKTHPIDIQILSVWIRKRVLDRHRVESPVGETSLSEKDLLEKICTRVPIVRVRHAVDGGVKRAVVAPLGAVYPHRRPVEGYRSGGPECRRQGKRVVAIPKTKRGQSSATARHQAGGRKPNGSRVHSRLPERVTGGSFLPGPGRGIVDQRANIVQRDPDLLHHHASSTNKSTRTAGSERQGERTKGRRDDTTARRNVESVGRKP